MQFTFPYYQKIHFAQSKKIKDLRIKRKSRTLLSTKHRIFNHKKKNYFTKREDILYSNSVFLTINTFLQNKIILTLKQ